MKITFKSTISNQSNEDNVIEFTSPVTISKMDDFDVYEFVEPQNNIMNRIEVSNSSINIFAGPSTINLILDEYVENEYTTPAGSVMFDSNMTSLDIKENQIQFEYTLGQLNNLFGNFKIELKIDK